MASILEKVGALSFQGLRTIVGALTGCNAISGKETVSGMRYNQLMFELGH